MSDPDWHEMRPGPSDVAAMEAEIDQLRAENSAQRVALDAHPNSVVAKLTAKIKRLQSDRRAASIELDAAQAALRKYGDELVEARAEIERLRVDKDVRRSQERNTAYEADLAQLRAENERLRAEIREAIERYEEEGDADYMVAPLRRALEHARKK